MADSCCMQYLNSLQCRVQCYLRRQQEHEAWQKYCEYRNLKTSSLFPQELRPQDLRQNKKLVEKELDDEVHKLKRKTVIRPHHSKTKGSSDKKPVFNDPKPCVKKPENVDSVFSKGISKEFVIKTPHLLHSLNAASNTKKVLPEVNFQVKSGLKNLTPVFPQNHCLQVPYSHTNGKKTISTQSKTNQSEVQASQDKVKNLHQFQIPSTIVFLECHVWGELLQDTVEELERISMKEALQRKELALLTLRHYLRNLQQTVQIVPDEASEVPTDLKTDKSSQKNGNGQTPRSSFRSHSLQGDFASSHSQIAKPLPVVLRLKEECIQSILHSQYEFEKHSIRKWPPVSGIEDFHQTVIHLSDSLLEDALDDVISELEEISDHLIHSCFSQEVQAVGNV